MVWAYELAGAKKPVTGDYDLWMVAPHMSHLTSNGFNIGRAGARDNVSAVVADMFDNTQVSAVEVDTAPRAGGVGV